VKFVTRRSKLVHNSCTGIRAIDRGGEHDGHLVVYYRASDRVPPHSRRP
jgi:hypothetical protein